MTNIKSVNTPRLNTPNITQSTKNDSTRPEKIESFINEVIPLALGFGMKADDLSKANARTTPTKTSSASQVIKNTGYSKAESNSFQPFLWHTIIGGVLEIATSWGKSTPAKGATSGSAIGAAIGTMITPGIGTALGAAIGAVAGGLFGAIKTGKHRDQKVRDAVRSLLVNGGVISRDYKIKLADGSGFDIGIDGGRKKELGGRRPFEIDHDNPLSKHAIDWLNPLVSLFSDGNEKVQTDFVGYFVNAAVSNAKSIEDVRANVAAIMLQFGMDADSIAQAINLNYPG